jgi:hypothetical protein
MHGVLASAVLTHFGEVVVWQPWYVPPQYDNVLVLQDWVIGGGGQNRTVDLRVMSPSL